MIPLMYADDAGDSDMRGARAARGRVRGPTCEVPRFLSFDCHGTGDFLPSASAFPQMGGLLAGDVKVYANFHF